MGTVGAQHGLHFGRNIPLRLAGSELSFLYVRYPDYNADTKGTAGYPGTVIGTSMSALVRFIKLSSLLL